MAKNNIQDTSQNKTNTFVKGLNKDSDPTFIAEGMWTHARNAVNNTIEGNIGTISNETSNVECGEAGATLPGKKYIIGTIHLYSDKWILFTVAYPITGVGLPTGHEVGLFEEDTCTYRIIVQDDCLNFDKRFLITGASREKEDCSWAVYFADGNNPDRYLNIGDNDLWPSSAYNWIGNNRYGNPTSGTTMQWPGVPWNQTCQTINDCIICEDQTTLNCQDLRLARLMSTPTVSIKPGVGGGVLRNGSYYAVIAYAIKGQRVTDYFSPSNTQPIWEVDDVAGCIDIFITADTRNFDEFELVVIQIINNGAVAKRIGLYSTHTSVVHLDQIKDDLITIPVEQIPIRNLVYETSDQITEVNNYLLRIAPRSRFDFNYQPLANQIQAQWVSVEYPANYYVDGGSNTNYLRDEVYTFFIRWIYNTGDKTSSYHIPGRAYGTFNGVSEIALDTSVNALDTADRHFEVLNTANILSSPGTVLADGGIVKAQGQMAYWESTEKYPDNRHDIWDASGQCWTGTTDPQFDLCGKPIRHHKFPDNITGGQDLTNHYANGGQSIRLMGVTFNNIIYPKDNDGNDIPGIVGYEILRGSREGNRSILAKGMINNMRTYEIKGTSTSGKIGLYPNHPFNTITPLSASLNGNVSGTNDPFFKITNDKDVIINQTVPTNMITFHSPDTNFRNPFLSISELKLYGSLYGTSVQYFQEPNQHPKFKLISDLAVWAMIMAGIVEMISQNLGKRSVNQPGAGFQRVFGPNIKGEEIKGQPITGGAVGSTSNNGSLVITAGVTSGALVQVDNVTYTNNGGGSINGGDIATSTDEYSDSTIFNAAKSTFDGVYSTWMNGAGILEALGGANVLHAAYKTFDDLGGTSKGGIYTAPTYTQEISGSQLIGNLVKFGGSFTKNLFYFAEGADTSLRLIYALLPYRQYALQGIAEGFYSNFNAPNLSQVQRFSIEDSFYLKDNIQNVRPFSGTNYVINNLKRQRTVTLRTSNKNVLPNTNVGPDFITTPGIEDKSLVTLGTAIQAGGLPLEMTDNKKSNEFNLPIASHYGGIKFRLRNQYGQLDSVMQIPITPSEQKLNYNGENSVTPKNNFWCTISTPVGPRATEVYLKSIKQTPVFFGGDTYVNRYTEKNNMFFFYDWLYGEPDGFEYNYILKHMISDPRFWTNSIRYEPSDLFGALDALWKNPLPGTGVLPTAFYNLDYFIDSSRKYDYNNDKPTGFPDSYPGIFGVKESYFYLTNSSIRDFFVESDVIVDFRQPGTSIWEKHYDHNTYTDLPTLFNADPMTLGRGNYYAYDYSLSISKVFTQYFTQGSLQSRYYNPIVSQLCYTYYPDRVIYSLPQQNESSKDSWFVYLVNNYKEFKNRITSVKPYAKTGMFITFQNSSPLIYQGTDTLETDLGTKITIGDGGLFANPPQNVSIADNEYEYGSSQGKFGVIGTPAGMFYISQNQGRVFAFEGGLKEISQQGMKWWFNLFLPYKLTDDFPNYPHTDNPVAGIGTQAVYDNYNSTIYFSKKDYKLREDLPAGTTVTYDQYGDYFLVNGISRLELGDPQIFESASWTLSFDPKSDYWVSFHDWHPDFSIPAKVYFMSTKGGKIWKHNYLCCSYCNFYDVQHPFEVEIPLITGQSITTLKSMEYILECYKNTTQNYVDQFHVLDFNFDKAVVYNTEQVSGYLNLNIFPKNNITLANTYPKINPGSIDVLFSKEENKYRFNQFWDITKNRGEFPIGSNYPPIGVVTPGTTVLAGSYTDEVIWNTQSNGYIKTLNAANLDYNKTQLQRKKFRHYLNFLYLSKADSKDINMILKLSNSKNQISLR
jgi:hypothetical protein